MMRFSTSTMNIVLLVVVSVVLHNARRVAAIGESSCEEFAPPAEIHGRKFFSSYSGDYLPIKGISYYPRPNEGNLTVTNSIDFFTEEYRHIWERDIEEFKELHVNAIRIYAIDPSLNHDGFMCALKAAGIYVIVGLAAECYNCAITFEAPPLCYHPELKSRGEYIINQFAKYENVLAFSAGNEVSLQKKDGEWTHNTENAPCQKKFLRDMRAYVNRCSSTMRKIPVGVVEADVDRADKALYYNCRSDPDDDLENADFMGINTYLHCDGSATSIEELVGYTELLQDYASFGMTIPVVWAEFGCLNESFETVDGYEAQRNFLQVEALFSKEFREEFVGGFAFEYSTEKVLSEATSAYPFTTYGPQNTGVGYFTPETCDDVVTECEYKRFPQFDTLADKYQAVDTSDEANAIFYKRSWPDDPQTPECPDKFPPLSSFTWPSDSVALQECPVEVPVFCAGVPIECNVVTLPPVAVSDASFAGVSVLARPSTLLLGLFSLLGFFAGHFA